MTIPPDAKLIYSLPEAKHVTNYLEDYCDNHVYDGRTLRDRIVFKCDVQSITKKEGVWHVEAVVGTVKKTVRSPKLVMASGLYTRPTMPDLPGVENFAGEVIHQKDFGRSRILEDPAVKNVVVLGGAKSAADIAYASLKAGKSVSWVLRESGFGAAVFSEPKGMLHYRNAPEIASTRLISLFTPSIFTPQNLFARLCHGTAWGRSLTRSIFTMTDKAALALGNFRAREGAREGFHKMESEPDYFWLNSYVGMAQQPDFWEQIARNVDVYKSDIAGVTENTIILDDGSSCAADAILCGTGYDRDFTLFRGPDAAELGLPVSLGAEAKDGIDWTALEKAADNEIISQLPALADSPPPRKTTTTPYRLYNLIAPLNDSSIVFLGYLGILNAFYTAECQAIWSTAYLDKRLTLPSLDERISDTARLNAFSKRRYPFLGTDGAAVNYDMIGYCERLLGQVGLRRHVPGGWWEYWFGICCGASLKGCTEEYLEVHGRVERGDES
jgi:cation diffusion facilitator CzcD-associated flavoprotein CzcO